jgi:serine phosphatase RsbU (regulator of sigma subunit)
VLYSDGITEATSKSGEEFGELRLESVVKAYCGKPLAVIQQQVLASVREWAGENQEDDMTLLLVRATEQPCESSGAIGQEEL